MRPNPSSIRLAVCAALGIVAVVPTAQAATPALPNGVYQAIINVTPVRHLTSNGKITSTLTRPGVDGAWNSTFSFNHLPNGTSQGMTDNKTDLTIKGKSFGSSKLGDGAGSWTMTVNGGTWTASNFQVDAILTTAGGTFVQYGKITGGIIDQTTGAMTLNPTGRMGAVSTVPGALWDIPAIPSGTTAYAQLITGTSTNASGSVTGHGIVPAGINPKTGCKAYNVILVSASNVGTAWGGFATIPYIETWNVNLAYVPPGGGSCIKPPTVQLNSTVGGVPERIVAPGSTVTVTAVATASSGQTIYSRIWTRPPDTTLVEVSGDGVTFTVPSSFPVGTPLTVKVKVNEVTTGTTTPITGTSNGMILLKVGAAGQDTNNTGIPNSTNKASTPQELQVRTTPSDGFLTVASPDTLRLGATAFCAGTNGAKVTAQEIAKFAGPNCTPPKVNPIDTVPNVGGYFDFAVNGLAKAGQVVNVVVPLTTALPAGAVWRKFNPTKGWSDFVVSGADKLLSALGSAGSCPAASSGAYLPKLKQGNYCVDLVISDGGPNDADGASNGAILDPGGVGASSSSVPSAATDFKGLGSGGCALGTDANPWHGGSWWLIGGMIGWLGFSRRRRSSRQS